MRTARLQTVRSSAPTSDGHQMSLAGEGGGRDTFKHIANPSTTGYLSVFSLTLARSPMASRSYWQVSDFLNYLPGLASDILVEWQSRKILLLIF